jgi:thiamine biosynthesis lipoprotein
MKHAPRDARVDGGVDIERHRELDDVRRFSHEAMATVFEVHVVHPDERYAAQAAHAAFELTDRLERELSRFLPNSDIARINHLAAGERTQVSPSTLECLVIARHLFDLTDGAFDISIGTELPSLELDGGGFLVRSTRSGVHLDLGGIGKGYAVDRMTELLEEWGLERALVHGGFSSVCALESSAGCEGWPVTLRDPGAPSRLLARLSMRQMAVSASGLQKGAHIVDPRNGDAVRGRLAAWAAVPRPSTTAENAPGDEQNRAATAVTDALATAFMLLSTEAIAALCERSPALEAWVLQESPAGEMRDPELLHFGGRYGR